jgi:phosphoribosylanthranilate isomerase
VTACRGWLEILFEKLSVTTCKTLCAVNTLAQRFMDFLSTDQTSLKICGVRTEADAQGLIDLGVDAAGFNFWPNSKRYLDPKNAAWLKSLEGKILRVGVFVNQPSELSLRLISEGMIDVVQLHGDENPEDAAIFSNAGIRVIKAIGVKTSKDIEKAGAFDVDAMLLDAHAPVVFGGTGETFDWSLALDFKNRYPQTAMILAGGITPQNAAMAVSQVKPAALDVASGAEVSPGVKDFTKVQQLLDACRRAL